MKKILLFGLLLIASGAFALDPTPNMPGATALMSPSELLEQATKDIDRRLAGLNRYIQARNIDSIENLVSEENKDFHANFLKFIENAPAFTVKRSPTEKIIMTPQGEYSFSALMTLNGKEAKISLSFIEEEGDQGMKWAILNSNLHIIGKTLFVPSDVPPPPEKKAPLTSSTLSDTRTSTPVPANVAPSDTPPAVVTTPVVDPGTPVSMSSEVVVLPPVKMDFPPVKKTPSNPSTPTNITTTQGEMGSLWIITIGIALILIFVAGIFYYLKKRKNVGNALLAASLATISAPVTSTLNTPTTPVASETPLEVLPVPSTPLSDEKVLPTPDIVPSTPIVERVIPEQNISNISLVQPESLTNTMTMEDAIIQPEETSQGLEEKEETHITTPPEETSPQPEAPLMLPQEKDIFLNPSVSENYASESGENIMETSMEVPPTLEEKIVTPEQHTDEDITILSQAPVYEASSSTPGSPEVGTSQDTKTPFEFFIESQKSSPTTPEITPDTAPNGSVA